MKDFISFIGHYSLNNILKVEFFKKRLNEGNRIGVNEIMYPYLQARDHLHLHDVYNIHGQLAGSDQRNNIIKSIRYNDSLYGILIGLLTDERGNKFSKSAGGPTP